MNRSGLKFCSNRSLSFLFFNLFLVMLQACANSQFGQELADSFDSSVQSSKEESAPKSKKPRTPKVKVINKKESSEVIKAVSIKPNPVRQRKSRSQKLNKPFKPQPYRITIQLSGANPSAPAESVTQALRGAGVSFEVEKIERIFNKPFSK